MSNNTVDLKYRKRFCDSWTFQTFASMNWGLSGELHDKTKVTLPLISVLQPSKMVFAFTHERSSSDKLHKFKPFCGV